MQADPSGTGTRARGRGGLAVSLGLALALLVGCSSKEERQAEYFQRAQTLYAAGDFEKARVEVRNVLQIDGNHPEGRYLYALLLEREQNWRQVLANLQLAVDLDPSYVEARIKLGQLYYRGQAYDEALAQAEEVLRLAPGNPDGHTLRGSVFYRRGDNARALAEARLALDSEPGHVGATSILAEVYKGQEPDRALAAIADAMQEQTDAETLTLLKIDVLEAQADTEAVADEYRRLIEAHPDNLFYYYKLVKFYEGEGRIDEAEDVLRSIVQAEPDNTKLKLWLAEFLANQRNLELAEATVREFIAREPGIYELRFALGRIYTALRQYDTAESVYGEIIERDVDGADSQQARNAIVELRLAQDDERGARQMLGEIFEIEKENTEALVTTARLALAANDIEAAIQRLRTAIKNEPDNYPALLLLARAHEREGAERLALDNYRTAVGVRPGAEGALLGAARLLIADGDADAARQMLDPYVAANPERGDAISLLVEALVTAGQNDRAMTIAEEAIASTPPLGQYLKGRLLLRQGDSIGAIASFKESLRLEPRGEQPLSYLVQTWLGDGEMATAEAFLRDRVAAYPSQPLGYELLGSVLVAQGQRAAARRNYERALALAPRRLGSLRGLVRAAADRDELEDVVPFWEAAVEGSDAGSAMRVELALLYERLGREESAKTQYRRVLAMEPANTLAANNLVMLLLEGDAREQDMPEALALADTLRRREEAAYRDTLAWLRYHNGEFEAAIAILAPLVEQHPDVPEYAYHLGVVHLASGDDAAARRYLTQVVTALSGTASKKLGAAQRLLASIGT